MKVVELAKYKGSSPVILLFYPAHFDLGLTSQLAQLTCLRDQLPAGTVLMAVTTDNVEAAQVWAERDTAKEGLKGYDVMLLRWLKSLFLKISHDKCKMLLHSGPYSTGATTHCKRGPRLSII
jgi:hypothetical protein